LCWHREHVTGSERLLSITSSSVLKGHCLVETQMPYGGTRTRVRIAHSLPLTSTAG